MTGARDGDQMEMFGAGALEIGTRKKTVEPRTPAQADYVRNLFKHELAFGIGPAGTGKTYLAVAVAVNQMINGHVDKIILSRPAVEAGERLGFLPGDMKEKVDPYMQPLYDALHDFLPGKTAGQADRGKDDRDRAARLHAGPDACRTPMSCWTRRRTPPRCR
jgi:phosphate starvation-inducible PhoH-like protein